MKRSNLRKISFLLSVILTAPSMAACGEGKIADETSVNDTGTTSGNVTGEQDEFADMDLGGQEIRIYTSTNADVVSRTSNYLIEGPDEETGDVVQDSAYFRNRSVEETLNVKLVYTDYDVNYASAAAEISKLVMSGDDLYDIIISKLYPMAGLSAEGNFRNIAKPLEQSVASHRDALLLSVFREGSHIYRVIGIGHMIGKVDLRLLELELSVLFLELLFTQLDLLLSHDKRTGDKIVVAH